MVTLQDLIMQARQRADMVNTQYVTDAELTNYANASAFELYDLLIAAYADYFVKDPVLFTLTGTQDTYALPSDFYKLRGLDRSLDNSTPNSYWTVHNFNFENRNKFTQFQSVQGTIPLTRYRVFASSTGPILKLIPEKNCNGNYRLWYIPQMPRLVSTSDVVTSALSGWEDYIIVDMVIKMLEKQEDDTAVFQMQKEALRARIEAMAASRDAEPEQITDSRSNEHFGPYGYNAWGGY